MEAGARGVGEHDVVARRGERARDASDGESTAEPVGAMTRFDRERHLCVEIAAHGEALVDRGARLGEVEAVEPRRDGGQREAHLLGGQVVGPRAPDERIRTT